MAKRSRSVVAFGTVVCSLTGAVGCSSLDGLSTTYGPSDPGPYDMFRQHNLEVVNTYRAMGHVPALVLDAQLNDFALAGSQELSMDHVPHQHFANASRAGTLFSSGFRTQAGENQGDPGGWRVLSADPTANELAQIDQIQQSMYAEGPGTGEGHGHYDNMMDARFTRLGVGLVEVGGRLYLTNDFSD